MCYEVRCNTCGKSTWAGCGRHAESVYRQIGEGKHCLCRDWPGVKLPQPSSGEANNTDGATAGSATDGRLQGGKSL